MYHLVRNISFVAFLSATAACSSDDDSSSQAQAGATSTDDGSSSGGAGAETPGSIVEIAAGNEDFSQLVSSLTAANLVEALSAEGPFTVFAPTDAAFDSFEAANPGVLAGLSTEELTAVLTHHVVAGKIMSSDLVDSSIAATLGGSYVGISVGDSVSISGATVTTPDIEASNGVIHVIDSLILPPSNDVVQTAVAAGSFTKLAEALTSTGLVAVLQGEGPFTVFAPTDAAFEAFETANPGVLSSLSNEELSNILLYHVASGWVGASDLSDGMMIPTSLEGKQITVALTNGAKVNSSSITQANLLASNGVIHVIDAILLPPAG